MEDGEAGRQAVRNSHQCQLSELSTFFPIPICLFLKGTGGPACTARPGLFTDSGRSAPAAAAA